MGQARKRGTREQRVEQAIARNNEKWAQFLATRAANKPNIKSMTALQAAIMLGSIR